MIEIVTLGVVSLCLLGVGGLAYLMRKWKSTLNNVFEQQLIIHRQMCEQFRQNSADNKNLTAFLNDQFAKTHKVSGAVSSVCEEICCQIGKVQHTLEAVVDHIQEQEEEDKDCCSEVAWNCDWDKVARRVQVSVPHDKRKEVFAAFNEVKRLLQGSEQGNKASGKAVEKAVEKDNNVRSVTKNGLPIV